MKCSEVPHPVQIKRHLFLVVVCVGQRRGLVGAHGGGPGARLRVRRADVVHAALAEPAEEADSYVEHRTPYILERYREY